jgi:hypothetical protein
MQDTQMQGEQYTPPPREGGFMSFVQQPRVMLVILAGWALLGFLTEFAVDSGLFVEADGSDKLKLDGLFAGLALNWEGIPLAVLYLYCARDPNRFHGVFWLALVAQGAAIASYLYHWIGTDTYSIGSVLIPLGVAAGLASLVFIHLFQPREERERA